MPPKGFIFAIESPGLSIALPFVLTGQSLEKYTKKIEIKMLPAPQSITLEELKTGLKELYLRSGCPTLGIVETESNKSEPTIRTETAKATMIEEKVTNMQGYNIFEYGLTCTLNTYGSVIYIRSYAGPSGAFEIIYEKVDKEPSKDHLKEMGQFVDSFVKIQKK